MIPDYSNIHLGMREFFNVIAEIVGHDDMEYDDDYAENPIYTKIIVGIVQ